jgi:hypothetical protein
LSDRSIDFTPGRSEVIPKIQSTIEYSQFCIKELYKWVHTSHVLIIQYDGYIINTGAWEDCFLDYDYIGAPWPDGQIGNGGFSLRSTNLQRVLALDTQLNGCHPEDAIICRSNRNMLERKYNMRFPPLEIAKKFSCEFEWNNFTFGFHGKNHFNNARKKVGYIGKPEKTSSGKLCLITGVIPMQ